MPTLLPPTGAQGTIRENRARTVSTLAFESSETDDRSLASSITHLERIIRKESLREASPI
jgi:hypothetical protein